MKTTLLSSLVLAAVANAQYFSTINLRSGSPIQFTKLAASDLRIWINKPTSSYCPTVAARGGACPNSTETNFIGGNGTLSMGAIVPGGQQVYIDPSCGALGYTEAHSVSMPAGALTTGFTRTPVADRDYDRLEFNGEGFLACTANVTSYVYQVFAPLKGVQPSGTCYEFSVEALPEKSADAWQYT